MSKKDIVIQEVLAISSSYSQKLTLRQIYYRLVAKLVIANTINQYKYLSRILVEARKNGQVPFDLFEDRTRSVSSRINSWHTFWKDSVNDKLRDVKSAPYIWKNDNVFQDKICIIALEKEALAGIFQAKVGNMCVLVVCRGYNSLTQVKELVDLLEGDEREKRLYFFSDFDPSGFDIQRNFIAQCEELGLEFDYIERVGLNEDQIEEHELPFAPTKMSDSRAKNWSYAGVVELDALDPHLLEDMIERCVDECYDKDLERWKSKVARIQRRRARKLYAKGLRKLAEEIMEEEED